MPLIKGLQGIFGGEALGMLLLSELRAIGVQGLRADCQTTRAGEVVPAATVAAIALSIRSVGMHPLITVAHATQCRLLEPGDHVELGNEPDLVPMPPAEYRRRLLEFYAAVAPMGLQVWAPAVSNLNQRGLEWLAATDPATWPAGINVSIHWYPHGESPTTPHPGFRSRDHEVETLQRIIGRRPWLVSEFGYHTGNRATRWQRWLGIRRQWTEAQVAEFVEFEWQFWAHHGAVGAVLYQLNDGVSGDPIDRYGIRRADGLYKPVARTFGGTS
jgi:hypothetical protein